jgi:hypothetical protein
MQDEARFTISFDGKTSTKHAIDLYDVSQALIGFQRSIALTTHLVLNGNIITQSPSLKGAKIYALPAEPGSWKLTAIVAMAGSGVITLGTAQNNSPIGHLVYSLYDYVISESIGINVDYNKSLRKLYEEAQKNKIKIPIIKESQADSLIEKCTTAITEMHRPIYKTETAKQALITSNFSFSHQPLRIKLTRDTYDFIHETRVAEIPDAIEGRISSYNANTFKGRIYIEKFGRPLSFELQPNARSEVNISIITASLHFSAMKDYNEPSSTIYCIAFLNTSKTGHIKYLTISRISSTSFT